MKRAAVAPAVLAVLWNRGESRRLIGRVFGVGERSVAGLVERARRDHPEFGIRKRGAGRPKKGRAA